MNVPIIGIGAAVSFWGIIAGNVAANQMLDEVEQKRQAKHEMFSDGQEINPIGYRRARAVSEYKASNPDGEKVRKLRNGQLLAVAGGVVVVIGFFI